MNHDDFIRGDVQEELAWAPQVRDAHVSVSVVDGVVTLIGEVDTYTEKIEAKNAALRVRGVTVVVNDLAILGSVRLDRTDTDIARAIEHVLEWSTTIPHTDLTVEVRDRVVVLTGTVSWNYQRTDAERLVRSIDGVLRLDNRIQLSPRASASDTNQLIKDALVRHALMDANAITVNTVGSEVTLSGNVSAWTEKIDAERAAWSSPNITAVHNKLTIGT